MIDIEKYVEACAEAEWAKRVTRTVLAATVPAIEADVRRDERARVLAEAARFLDFEGIRPGYTGEALATDLAAFVTFDSMAEEQS